MKMTENYMVSYWQEQKEIGQRQVDFAEKQLSKLALKDQIEVEFEE